MFRIFMGVIDPGDQFTHWYHELYKELSIILEKFNINWFLSLCQEDDHYGAKCCDLADCSQSTELADNFEHN